MLLATRLQDQCITGLIGYGLLEIGMRRLWLVCRR
jgi:hypothetical protein